MGLLEVLGGRDSENLSVLTRRVQREAIQTPSEQLYDVYECLRLFPEASAPVIQLNYS